MDILYPVHVSDVGVERKPESWVESVERAINWVSGNWAGSQETIERKAAGELQSGERAKQALKNRSEVDPTGPPCPSVCLSAIVGLIFIRC